ncbi:MAG: class I SAM-dependent methyltransferase [Comamonadaceae bacterium]|nr:MAG: class I SAM-dependent methyltransferase [Comamonadaceae bacterium]
MARQQIRGWLLALVALGAAFLLPIAAAQQQPAYTRGAASADGIGKRFMGREIAHVMGWQGAAWLEREEREKEERTDLLLKALDLKPGMVVADIGAGTGYLSRRMARAVGTSGKVLAVDVQPEMVTMLRNAAEKEGLGNIVPSLGTEADVKLAPASVDLAIMVDVYHELSLPYEVVASVVKALKPGGQLVFVEYRAEDAAVPIKLLHKMSEAQVRREAEVHPLEWVKTVGTLPWQHVIVFRKSSSK